MAMPAGSGVLDLNAITPQMLAAAGMSQQQFNRGLGNIPTMPVTQEDRDKLGRVRQKRLKYIRVSSIVLLMVSGLSIIDGIVAAAVATEFPHALGAGMIAGFPGLLIAGLGLWLTEEGKKNSTGDTTTPKFQRILKCHLVWAFVVATFLMMAWGIGAVWPLADCTSRAAPDDVSDWDYLNTCKPNPGLLTALAVVTLLIITALIIAFFVNVCSYCCVLRAFGVKSGYELLLDMQMMRIAEMNREQTQTQQPVSMHGQQQPVNMYGQQQQQQQPVNMYGQQQQPVNTYGQPMGGQMAPNQQQYGGHQPSAPPLSAYSDDVTSKSDPPPSYSEVMNQ